MKKIIVLILLMFSVVAYSELPLTGVSVVEGSVSLGLQTAWEIADTELSGDTQATALSVTERTKKILDTLIAAAASGDDNITIFPIPSKWQTIRLRAIGITDAGTRTDQIYFGTLGGGDDCELVYAAQLAWTLGTQQTIYDQITFTSGGTYEPKPGELVTGNSSDETAVVVSTVLSSGAWADGDAAGTITYRSATGTFTNSETISIVNPLGATQSNVLTHAASDLIDFEFADTLTRTAKSWGGTWTQTSPVAELTAETEVDRKEADIMVILTTVSSADTKLLINGGD